jgi:putative transposase
MEILNKNKNYNKDSHLVYSCQYHIVFCPKYRRPVLVNKVSDRFKEIVIENQEKHKYNILEMEVMDDHVHLLLDINPRKGVYDVVNRIKGITSRKLREEFPALKSRLPSMWTRSKFISSVGSVSLNVIQKYIKEQKNV